MKRFYIGFLSSIFFAAIFLNCEHKDQNKIDLQVLITATGNVIYINGEVDPDKISSCGVAVPEPRPPPGLQAPLERPAPQPQVLLVHLIVVIRSRVS